MGPVPTLWWIVVSLAPFFVAMFGGGQAWDGVRSVSESLDKTRGLVYASLLIVAAIGGNRVVRWWRPRWRASDCTSVVIVRLQAGLTSGLLGLAALSLSPFWFPVIVGPPPNVVRYPSLADIEAKRRAEIYEAEIGARQAELKIRTDRLLNDAWDILSGDTGGDVARDRWEITPHELDLAHRKLDEVLVLDPDNKYALHMKAVAFSQGAEDEAALRTAEYALRVQHGDRAHENYATTLARMGRYELAIKHFEVALGDPKCCSAGSRANFAWALAQKGDSKRSEQEARKAIAMDPATFWAYDILATALHQQGRNDEALEVIKRSIDLNPKWEMSYVNAASFSTTAGRYREAIAFARKAIQIDPRYHRSYIVLGTALSMIGDKKGCLQAAKDAVRANLRDPRAHNFLGKALAENGDYRQAILSFQQAADLDPKEESYAWYVKHATEHAAGKQHDGEKWVVPEDQHVYAARPAH